MTKTALTILIFLMMFTESAFVKEAYAVSPAQISIPEKLGFVIQSYESKPMPGSNNKLIIYIQDFHTHYEAQKNLASILEKLVKDFNLNLVLVEGGWGDVSLSYLRDYGSKEKRLEVAEKYLKNGEISGEEYLDIMSDYPIKLQGIEDENLYNEHVKTFVDVEKFQDKAKIWISNLQDITDDLKNKIYSQNLQDLDRLQKDKEGDRITLALFCQELSKIANNADIDYASLSDFNKFVELAKLEKEVDHQKIEDERKYLISQLDSSANKEELESVSDEALNKADENQLSYYKHLDELAKNKLPDFNKSMWAARSYANLNTYIKYLETAGNIDLKSLTQDIQILTGRLKKSLFTNDDERKLSEISDSLKLLDNLVSLKLTPEEYEVFQSKRNAFTFNEWVEFLKTNAAKYNLTKTVDADYAVVADNLDILGKFYQIGEKRNDVFMRHIFSAMEDNGENITCLITGGFHTPFIIEQLKEKGVSYCVVAPRITQPSDDALYVKILKEKAGIK